MRKALVNGSAVALVKKNRVIKIMEINRRTLMGTNRVVVIKFNKITKITRCSPDRASRCPTPQMLNLLIVVKKLLF